MLYDPKWQSETIAPWRQVLLDAADLIDRRGLAQRTLHDTEGRLCIQGAILLVARARTQPYDYALDHIAYFCGGDFRKFNDAPGRTKKQVVAALRQCARL